MDFLFNFFSDIGKVEIPSVATPIAKLGIAAPDYFKNATIRLATKEDKPGNKTFTMSSMKLGWLAPFVAKTKCTLLCVETESGTHCLHLCVTCLDSWPGPGCYLHGSWD